MRNLYSAMPEGFLGGRIDEILSASLTIDQASYEFTSKEFVKEIHQDFEVGDLVAFRLFENKISEIRLLAKMQRLSVKTMQPKKIQEKSFLYLALWSEFQMVVRSWFHKNGFLEVQTPYLVDCPGTEPYLDLFSTDLVKGSLVERKYLPTSPELHLKKMLSQGLRKIFEIKTCFRNSEVSPTHQPEFVMLEWYRAYDQLSTIKADLQSLILHICDHQWESLDQGNSVAAEVKSQLHKTKQALASGFLSISMQDLWKQRFDFCLTPQTTAADLRDLAKQRQIHFQPDENFDDLFNRIFVDQIETRISCDKMIFLEKYPPSQAALARLTEDGWGDRFEFYFAGLEIANAFHELNDPKIQRQRFQEDLELKRKLGKEVPPLDDQFLEALDQGMPPSGGIALGLERLCMAIFGIKDIKSLRVFPV